MVSYLLLAILKYNGMCSYICTLNCLCKQSSCINNNTTVSFQYFIIFSYQPHCCYINTVSCGWCEVFKDVNTSEMVHIDCLCCFIITVVNLHASKSLMDIGMLYITNNSVETGVVPTYNIVICFSFSVFRFTPD